MIKLTIEKTDPYSSDSWYQAFLVIGDTEKQSIGRSFFGYDDCRINAEKIVEEFARQGIYILHSEIYNLMPS